MEIVFQGLASDGEMSRCLTPAIGPHPSVFEIYENTPVPCSLACASFYSRDNMAIEVNEVMRVEEEEEEKKERLTREWSERSPGGKCQTEV